MSIWGWILAAAAIAYVTKLVGYLLPEKWLEGPAVQTISAGLTVGLLASLVATNTFVQGQALVLDSKIVGLVAAIVGLRLKLPFLVVVILGAGATALGRLAGLP